MTMQTEETETQSLAPAWLSRQQRRYLDRILNKLVAREACSICGSAWPHNSRIAYGFDHNDRIVVVGECCLDRIAVPFGVSPARESAVCMSEIWKRLDEVIALQQRDITAANKQFEGGTDDRTWFEQNPQRSHRARMPFPGEEFLLSGGDDGANSLPECTSFILVRQIKPDTRIRRGFYLNTALLPVPDDEALIHAMFEIASSREPAPRTMQEFTALRDKYAILSSSC
jgi:hypothetical protein